MITDILLDDDKDLIIKDGDFVVGDSIKQHQEILLMSDKGNIRQSPAIGVGVMSFFDDEDTDGLIREVRKQFVRDGMTVKTLNVGSDGIINIKAPYNG